MTVEFFAYARWVGFFWIMAMLVIAFLAVRGHRLIFLTMLLWVGALFASSGFRQGGNSEVSDFVRDWIATPLLFAVPIAMSARVLQYLKGKRHE